MAQARFAPPPSPLSPPSPPSQLFSADGNGVVKRWELVRGAELRMLHSIEKAELLGAPAGGKDPPRSV